MKISEIKDLMTQFDGSSLREFSLKHQDLELYFSKNETKVDISPSPNQVLEELPQKPEEMEVTEAVAGEVVTSPLVGVAYLAPAPDKPAFVTVGDVVKKGQTLLIIEAMKVMNEVPAPCDGVVTEVLVQNGDMVEFGKGLVRLA